MNKSFIFILTYLLTINISYGIDYGEYTYETSSSDCRDGFIKIKDVTYGKITCRDLAVIDEYKLNIHDSEARCSEGFVQEQNGYNCKRSRFFDRYETRHAGEKCDKGFMEVNSYKGKVICLKNRQGNGSDVPTLSCQPGYKLEIYGIVPKCEIDIECERGYKAAIANNTPICEPMLDCPETHNYITDSISNRCVPKIDCGTGLKIEMEGDQAVCKLAVSCDESAILVEKNNEAVCLDIDYVDNYRTNSFCHDKFLSFDSIEKSSTGLVEITDTDGANTVCKKTALIKKYNSGLMECHEDFFAVVNFENGGDITCYNRRLTRTYETTSKRCQKGFYQAHEHGGVRTCKINEFIVSYVNESGEDCVDAMSPAPFNNVFDMTGENVDMCQKTVNFKERARIGRRQERYGLQLNYIITPNRAIER